MGYSEAVKRKFPGDTNEKKRREELWGKIADAYERGGEDTIKSVLLGEAEGIYTEFDRLLRELRKKL